ncbi:nucleic-acid-binding protein from transposon X-element [Trichonephila clavipes]|nr:nucleic-acid-binding protein from transposon X-element [Trichonephila clavipes]
MNGHEGNRFEEQVIGDDMRDPDQITRLENIGALPPTVHCARIRSLQKLIRYAETRIRYQQELIDIETFDQRDTETTQLQTYIHAKGAAELDYNMKMEEENNMDVVADSDQNSNDEVVTLPKVKPIMLRYKKNFNLILHHLNRKYPDSVNKLTGEYIKITAASIDHTTWRNNQRIKTKRRGILRSSPPGDRPLKMVLKGLLFTTDIEDIKSDLENQGLPVMKVAQLTQRNSKFPLPLFLVEVRKNVPDSRDIRDFSTCCYMSITWDSFRRRPGPSQCYNCNYFHHSSLNCEIKTRCLKCGQEHRTSDCPNKEKIKNPECINCKATGHMANWSQCPKFSKTKPKKGDALNDKNKNNVNQNRPIPLTLSKPPLILATLMLPKMINRWQHKNLYLSRRRTLLSPTPSLKINIPPLARIFS